MAEFYMSQERAMTPGISGAWPNIIPHNKNGRLVRIDGAENMIKQAVAHLEFLGNKQTAEELRKMFL